MHVIIKVMQESSDRKITHRFAGTFIVTEAGRVIGQHRDDIKGIDHPGKVGLFGGSVEEGEDPHDGAWRELIEEETNLKRTKDEILYFFDDIGWREFTNEWETRYFYHVKITDDELKNLEVYEGQEWTYIEGGDDPRFIDVLRDPLKRFFDTLPTLY